MESVTVEFRPLLRSICASIFLENSISSRVDVKLLENAVEIHLENKIFRLELPSIKIIPTSLSSLVISCHWISFRTLTEPNSLYGKFESEIINLENKFNDSFSISSKKAELPPQNINCRLLCFCCQNEISKTLCFQRILPLPSSGCDPQEWFCHQHDHGDDHEFFSLEPKETDCFYYINYFLLNKHVLKENLKLKDTLVYCNRCYSILGAFTEKNKRSLKFWTACTRFKFCSDNSIIGALQSTLTELLFIIQDIAEFVIGETILLEARDANNFHHVLIKIMERKLNIFTQDKVSSYDQVVNLKSSFVVKVLYKYNEKDKTVKNNNEDIKFCEISLPSILNAIDQLINSTERFPPAHRKAGDFYIGYLPLQVCEN